MIIVKLMGGLGNQMFQYAAARRLAHSHNTSLKLDLSWFNYINAGDTVRKYELNNFTLKEEFATPSEVLRVYEPEGSVFGRLIRSVNPFYKQTHVREKYYHFDSNMMKKPDNIYLEGYWQSEKYFKEIEEIICKEFSIKNEPDELNNRLARMIESTEAVSVHVRRGDYVTNKTTSDFHGICSWAYYMEAVEKIALQVPQPHFFIFSDDPEGVKENVKFNYPVTFIDSNGPEKAYEDLRLMTLCKYHIIANSSFSWWGAWLCRNPSKRVIAPKKWFNREDVNTNDLIPDAWIRI